SNGQVVTYANSGGSAIGGLVSGTKYAVHVLTSTTLQLIPAIDLTSAGTGVQTLNGALTIGSVDTANDIITTAFNHGFANGQTITYSSTGTPIGGLVSGQQYQVQVVSPNSLKLTPAINLTSTPSTSTA